MKKIASFILVLFLLFGSAIGLTSLSRQADAADKQYLVPGGNLIQEINQNIYYSTRTIDKYVSAYNMPGYISTTYTCGINAGVNLIAWYNRIYSTLIPNHTAGATIFGKWMWSAQNTIINNLFPTVNTLMNGTSNGVTINGYLNGLKSFVNGKNLTFTSASLRNSNGTLNPNYKTELSNGKLLSIFLDGFNVTYGPAANSGYDQLMLEEYAGAHVMTVYGWTDISYYNSQGVMFRKDSYLHVGTGYGSPSNAMLLINSYCTIDALYTTHVS